jgi:hypothetical protein
MVAEIRGGKDARTKPAGQRYQAGPSMIGQTITKVQFLDAGIGQGDS